MFSTDAVKVKTIASALLLLVAVVGLAFGAGVVAGQEADADGEFVNETVPVTNDTGSVYLEVTNVTNGPVNVTVSGVENGTETVVDETQIDAENTSTLTEWDADAEAYDEYRVVVSEDSTATNQTVETFDVGTFEMTSGGGGGLLGGDGGTTGAAAVVVVLAGYLVLRDGDD